MTKESFDEFYGKIYSDRWPELRRALLLDIKVAFEPLSPQFDLKDFRFLEVGQSPERLESGLLRQYFMDPASLLVARVLPVAQAEKVLDMCAAPGGKTLVLASQLMQHNPSAQLIANEISMPRRESLKKVIQNYIPMDFRRQIWIKGSDGVRYGLQQPQSYDSILLDAPCSGEAHVLANPADLAKWTRQRPKGLAMKQYSLLSSAWAALRPGGFLLYSTCSINPMENDHVIGRLLQKKGAEVHLERVELQGEAEKLDYGFQYFPDRAGFGPLYACLLRKTFVER
jgi:16S rRNA C967 or C1407 C5-methylase (RsmB/RsmF family)